METQTARVILALACERLDQPAEVRRQLERARAAIGEKFSSGLAAGSRADGFWYDWVFARALLDEAEKTAN